MPGPGGDMDDVQFESLAALIERDGPLPVDRALALLREAARALAEAHAAGILHCDLQPSTLLVTSEGGVLLAESALTRPQGEEREPDTPETERYVSPLYYPPEAAHKRPLDVRTDLFLLGATFYHAMAGKPPFDGSDPEARALQYIRRDAPPLEEQVPGTPVLVNVMLQKLLRRKPEERYQSAEELLAVIERTERMLQKRQPARRAPAAAPAAEAEPEDVQPQTRRFKRAAAAAAPAAEAAPEDTQPQTRRFRVAAAAEPTPEKHPTTARAKAAAKPFWQSKAFIYAAAAGGFLLIVIVLLLLRGGGGRPQLAQQNPVAPSVPPIPEPAAKVPVVSPAKETKSKVEVPKPKPKTSAPVVRPVEPPPPKPKDPPPRKSWQPVKGTAAGTETYKEFLERTKDLEVHSFEDYVVKWEFAGPYQVPTDKEKTGPFDTEFPPEKKDGGEKPSWAALPTGSNPARPWLFDFKKTREVVQVAAEHAAIYLRTRIHSSAKQDVQIWAGSDDALKIWLNGSLAHSNRRDRAVKPDEDKLDVTLNQGWNDVMVKVSQGSGEWGFCLRFRTRDGQEAKGLRADPAGK